MFNFAFCSGITAACVHHLDSKPERQLRKVTDMDKRRLKGLANKEMVKEILKVHDTKKECHKYQRVRGRGRGSKRYPLSASNDMCGTDTKKFRASLLNGQFTERTLHTGLTFQSQNKRTRSVKAKSAVKDMAKKKGLRTCGHSRQKPLSMSLNELDNSEMVDEALLSRSTRTTRTLGTLDEFVSVNKEGRVWKITLCSEKKQNALTTEVSGSLGKCLFLV